ncbi:hypothetical protein [Stutzerimonas kirkiae]|nr:hypothetical protein [Stutzerimonas kirkiae]
MNRETVLDLLLASLVFASGYALGNADGFLASVKLIDQVLQ